MISLAETLTLIKSRRSWKPAAMDADRPVDRSLLDSLFEAAQWAPTHGLTEPWRFRIFTGAARERLAAHLPSVYDAVTPAAECRPEKREKLSLTPRQASVVIALGCAVQPGGKIPLWEEQCAVAAAVQNMHLAATAAGLAAMWSSPPLCGTEPGRQALGFEPGVTGLGFFYVGWPKPSSPPPQPAPRRAWEQRVVMLED